MQQEFRVASHEGHRLHKATLLHKGGRGEDNRKEVDPRHHLEGADLIGLEDLALPIGSEGVEDEVAQENDDPREGGGFVAVVHSISRSQQEHADSEGDHECGDVLMPLVGPFGDKLPHDHHWNDLGSLGKDLDREADKLEGFILEPATHDIGDGAEGVFVEWSCVPGLLLEVHHDERHHKGQDTIDKHQELRILEVFTFLCVGFAILEGHDAFLEKAPGEVECKEATCTEEQLECLHQHGGLSSGGFTPHATLLQTALLMRETLSKQPQEVGN